MGKKPQSDIFKEPTVPPPRKVKKAPAREAVLALEIDSQIQDDMQWIFRLDREQWHEHLPSGWSTSAPLHPAMRTLLNSTTLPLWAAVPPLSKEWAVIQEAWFVMVFATQKMDEFLTTTYATEETIKSALKFLPY